MPGALSRTRPWNGLAAAVVLVTFLVAASQLSRSAQRQPAGPLTEQQVEGLVRGGVYSGRIALLVEQRGIDFKPSQGYLQHLRKEGAQEVLIKVLVAEALLTPSLASNSPNPVAVRSPAPAERRNSTLGSNSPNPAAVKSPAPAERRNSTIRPTADPTITQDSTDLQRDRLTSILTLAGKYDQQKRWADAEQQYRAAISLEPHRASTHLALGRVLIAENDPQVAMREYRQAITLQPDLADAHEALGSLLIQRGGVGEGISEYRDALRLNSHDTQLRAKLAALLYSTGDLESAVAEYRSLETRDPDDSDIHYRLGLALYAESNLAGAAAQLREALRLDPASTQAHGALGDVLLKEGNRYGALEEYRTAASSSSPDLRESLDWLLNNMKH
jgi:Flp pilus assembly protein TadD